MFLNVDKTCSKGRGTWQCLSAFLSHRFVQLFSFWDTCRFNRMEDSAKVVKLIIMEMRLCIRIFWAWRCRFKVLKGDLNDFRVERCGNVIIALFESCSQIGSLESWNSRTLLINLISVANRTVKKRLSAKTNEKIGKWKMQLGCALARNVQILNSNTTVRHRLDQSLD